MLITSSAEMIENERLQIENGRLLEGVAFEFSII
jgi:hypothetical protein